MLTHLSIQNFTLVERLDLDLAPGMTVISGETGAGKSIVLDALGLTLGDRAEGDRVRMGAARADISASFDVSAISEAREWLATNDLSEGDNTECLLRRVMNNEGKSKSYVNGQPVTLQQLRTLGEMLIDIHSQHEHQSLLLKDTHRRLLDEFAGHTELALQVRTRFRDWNTQRERYEQVRNNAAEISARHQLLSYQVQELEQLGLTEGELEKLEAEQRQLANAGGILQASHELLALCNDDESGLSSNLHRALQLFRNLPEKTPALKAAEDLLLNAQIQVDEARHEIDHHIDSFQLDPERLGDVELRLSTIYDVARKHRVRAEELPELLTQLSNELADLQGGDGHLDQLAEAAKAAEQAFFLVAQQLSAKRQAAGLKLANAVNQQLKSLSMQAANFTVQLNPISAGSNYGLEEVEFLISTNPGQAPKPLAKIASGGELSRISLAIQVVTAQTSATPTLVFDEVDVGIGGATADVVGQLLRKLGETDKSGRKGQVICVTHLPQVASKGHQHLLVTKESSATSAATTLVPIEGEQKVNEIARMLGGVKITEQSLAHAREFLAI